MPSSLSQTSAPKWSACPVASLKTGQQRTLLPLLGSICWPSMLRHTLDMMCMRSSSGRRKQQQSQAAEQRHLLVCSILGDAEPADRYTHCASAVALLVLWPQSR